MLTHLDHLALATRDLDGALATLRRLGPLVEGEHETIGEPHFVRAVMVCLGDGIPIELIQPTDPRSPVAAFIEKRGEGIQHVAFRVADLDAALAQCRQDGMRLIDERPRPGYAGSRIAFVHPKSTLGMLTELVERQPGRDRPPYALAH